MKKIQDERSWIVVIAEKSKQWKWESIGDEEWKVARVWSRKKEEEEEEEARRTHRKKSRRITDLTELGIELVFIVRIEGKMACVRMK